jgi:uncharacterized repeat protein (TIGR01451 family)
MKAITVKSSKLLHTIMASTLAFVAFTGSVNNINHHSINMDIFNSAFAANNNNNVSIQSNAFVEKVSKDNNGREVKTEEAANHVVPGETVVFKNIINNKNTTAAKDIVVTNPVAEHMSFLSAYSNDDNNTIITYSLDGKEFLAIDKLTVKDKTTGQSRSALPEEIKFVRWSIKNQLAANSSLEVGYKAVLQ